MVGVANLNARGPGSLQAACDAEGPRIVVFRVGGTIVLTKPLVVRQPFVTVAGQTAPGDGICLRGAGLSVSTHDVVIRYIRARPGDHPVGPFPGNRDAIGAAGPAERVHSVIFDHCSASWAIDEVAQTWYGPRDITFQWCIVSESLQDSLHEEGPHGKGVILGSERNTFSVHHCLIAHHIDRHPLLGPSKDDSTPTVCDWRNNVVYNHGPWTFGTVRGHTHMNYVGNTIKPGPDSGTRIQSKLRLSGSRGQKVYFEDNVLTARPAGLEKPDAGLIAAEPFETPPVTTQGSKEALEAVLRSAGATLPVRDVIDARVVDEVRTGTGRVIDSQDDVGGWPVYAGAAAPRDSDRDGMPDAWERAHGLNPASAADGPADADGDLYTNIEEYLNGTDPRRMETDEAPVHADVIVQSGNDGLRGAEAHKRGAELRMKEQKAAVDPATLGAFLKKARSSRKEVAEFLGVTFVAVEACTFSMDRDDETRWGPYEVTLSGYEIAAREITQEQWTTVMGTRPWSGRLYARDDPRCPASYVSWEDCQAFIERLNACRGPWRYALPTNAQWDCAARAGTGLLLGVKAPGGRRLASADRRALGERIWSKDNTIDVGAPHPHPVASRKPNPWGLYDMAGNVHEWCQDWYGWSYWRRMKKAVSDPAGPQSGEYRICRGKSFFRPLKNMLYYSSNEHRPGYRSFEMGFRLVRTRRR